jgi:hypothetical protein
MVEGRAHHDHGPAGVVHPLAQQVLSEAALLALDHVGERLELALVGAGDRLAAAAVVQKSIHGLLQHALLVANDDIRRIQVEKPLQAIVAVDDAPVQVVQVGGRESAAIQRHERPQIRRQHRQDLHDHPFRPVAGLDEGLDDLEPLGELLDLGFRAGRVELFAQLHGLRLEVHGPQQVPDGLGAHLGPELVTILLDRVEVGVLRQQHVLLEGRHARLDHDVGFEVQHALDFPHRHIQDQAEARRQGLQEPDMRDRAGELDVAHSLAAHLGQGDLHTALLTDHTAMFEALVLAAQALVVADRTEQLGAEQPVALRLEGAVVDGLRLLDLSI